MNKKTYELFANPDDHNEDGYIALDPEIATIIATLNSKNYKTVFGNIWIRYYAQLFLAFIYKIKMY